jgi:hypothetical protein
MFDEIGRIFQDYYLNTYHYYHITLLFLCIVIDVENFCRAFNLQRNSWKIPKPAPLIIGTSAVELLSSEKIISSTIQSSRYTRKCYTNVEIEMINTKVNGNRNQNMTL